MVNEAALLVMNISKHYGEFTAVNRVSFQVQQGEVFGLLGPNGAGKSTLIGMLTSILPPSSGTAVLGGYDIVTHSEQVKRLVGLVPQEVAIYEALSAKENLHFFGRMFGIKGKLLDERVEYCLSVAQLHEWKDKPTGQFSGGMKRRLNLAVGLIHNPQILFLDEPTVGVDPQSRNHIFSSVKKLTEEGLTVIYTTHYIEEAQNLCSRVAIYDQGTIIAIDTPQNFISGTPHKDLETVFLDLTGRKLRD